jgi:transcriptional regulator with XRE-family HTH domain
MAVEAGAEIRDERRRRRLTLREVAARCGLAVSEIHRLESGRAGTLASYAAVASALGLRAELHLLDARRIAAPRIADPVHSLMGEVEAALLAGHGFAVTLDEPFQHYQFAGRADLLAISADRRALLHIENRTRFPNLQEAFGRYNAKRAYLAASVAQRLAFPRGFEAVSHVIVALWSSEVLHVLRLRTASFEAICPDRPDVLLGWFAGRPPASGVTSALLVLDPIERSRGRRWIGMAESLKAEPRYRGYSETVDAMREHGQV